MRLLFLTASMIGAFLSANAQTDTTQYLFKGLNYSYLQYSLGYSPMFFNHGQTIHGFSGSLFGIVLSDKIAFGLDIDGANPTATYPAAHLPRITSFVVLSLNIEPLIRPRKIINFSFPVKIGYGGALYESALGNGFFQQEEMFLVVNPSAMAWVNLFKPLSLGVGGSYRMAFNKDDTTFDRYSGFSAFVMLRFKFYTKEFQQKMIERQKQYMQQQAPK
jgi:hypothetical protein